MITDLAEALKRLKSFPQCRTILTVDDDTWVTELLIDSVGKTATDVTVYRIYYVISEILSLIGNLNKTKREESYLEGSVEYFSDINTVNAFLEMQAKQDIALGLTVPDTYSSITLTGNFEAGRQAWLIDKEITNRRTPESIEDRYIDHLGVGTIRGFSNAL